MLLQLQDNNQAVIVYQHVSLVTRGKAESIDKTLYKLVIICNGCAFGFDYDDESKRDADHAILTHLLNEYLGQN